MTGAVTGAIIGGVCGAIADAVSTGGLSLLAGTVISAGICGVVASAGNAANQYWNYKIEKKSHIKAQTLCKNNLPNNTVTQSSNATLPVKYECFSNYVDAKSIAVSGIAAAVFAPVGIGANCIVNSAFVGLETGGINITGQIIANFAMGGNLSVLQGIIDLL